MIFTIGHKESYEEYFSWVDSGQEEKIEKTGRNAEYAGGSVWRTEAEARAHAPAGYEVYGVLADWERDTEPSQEGDWHDLLVDAEVVRLGKGLRENSLMNLKVKVLRQKYGRKTLTDAQAALFPVQSRVESTVELDNQAGHVFLHIGQQGTVIRHSRDWPNPIVVLFDGRESELGMYLNEVRLVN